MKLRRQFSANKLCHFLGAHVHNLEGTMKGDTSEYIAAADLMKTDKVPTITLSHRFSLLNLFLHRQQLLHPCKLLGILDDADRYIAKKASISQSSLDAIAPFYS